MGVVWSGAALAVAACTEGTASACPAPRRVSSLSSLLSAMVVASRWSSSRVACTGEWCLSSSMGPKRVASNLVSLASRGTHPVAPVCLVGAPIPAWVW